MFGFCTGSSAIIKKLKVKSIIIKESIFSPGTGNLTNNTDIEQCSVYDWLVTETRDYTPHC